MARGWVGSDKQAVREGFRSPAEDLRGEPGHPLPPPPPPAPARHHKTPEHHGESVILSLPGSWNPSVASQPSGS